MRRLPVYLLLDCSESMVGDALKSVQLGVETLLKELRSDPHALETAWISIITFNNEAIQVLPLTELMEVKPPNLEVRPGTCLGKAFALLRNCIEGEVRRGTGRERADYRPLVFLLTDGQPTDDWQIVKEAVDNLTSPKIANFYSIGCGEDVDFETLSSVSDAAFKLSDMNPETLRKLFIWMTASVKSASVGVGNNESVDGLDFSIKPVEVTEVKPGSHRRYKGPSLQVFLKGYCIDNKRPYLMRYRLIPESNQYEPVASHELPESATEDKKFKLPSINASSLLGCPPCPYCSNPAAGVCACKAILCLPSTPVETVMCPKCGETVEMNYSDGEFDIQQSAG